MPSRISDPVENAPLQHALDALLVKLADRERTTTALARQNAELSGELQRRLAESESFNRVLVSLLQKTVSDARHGRHRGDTPDHQPAAEGAHPHADQLCCRQ